MGLGKHSTWHVGCPTPRNDTDTCGNCVALELSSHLISINKIHYLTSSRVVCCVSFRLSEDLISGHRVMWSSVPDKCAGTSVFLFHFILFVYILFIFSVFGGCWALWDLDRMQCKGIGVQRSRLSCVWNSFLEKHCFDCLLPYQVKKTHISYPESQSWAQIFYHNIFTVHSCNWGNVVAIFYINFLILAMQLILDFWNYVMVQIYCAAVPNHVCKLSRLYLIISVLLHQYKYMMFTQALFCFFRWLLRKKVIKCLLTTYSLR